MSVLIQMCFISVVGGFVNVAQITRVYDANDCMTDKVCLETPPGTLTETGDKTAEDFIRRVQATCGGNSK